MLCVFLKSYNFSPAMQITRTEWNQKKNQKKKTREINKELIWYSGIDPISNWNLRHCYPSILCRHIGNTHRIPSYSTMAAELIWMKMCQKERKCLRFHQSIKVWKSKPEKIQLEWDSLRLASHNLGEKIHIHEPVCMYKLYLVEFSSYPTLIVQWPLYGGLNFSL